MRYLGGKQRLASKFAHIIGEGELLIEPFVGGGGSLKALAPNFGEVRASDIHEDLILMWQALQNGWVPPDSVSEEEYKSIKNCPPSALRGFIGFGCSWGGKWFGGYARYKDTNFAKQSKNSLLKTLPNIRNVSFSLTPYHLAVPPRGSVVYADPPYKGTTGYAEGGFDHDEFWKIMELWVENGVKVYVSELSAPDGWESVWSFKRKAGCRGDLKTSTPIEEHLYSLSEDDNEGCNNC